MKKTLTTVTLLLILFTITEAQTDSVSSKSEGQTIDKVVAIVGDQMIKLSDVNDQYWQAIMQGEKQSFEFECEVFEEILLQKLLLAQAKADSITVSDSQVDSELDRRVRYFVSQLGSPDALEKFYNKSILEIKEEFRELIQEQLLIQTMQGKITENVKITPAEVKRYFNNLPTDSIPAISAVMEIGQISIIPAPSEKDKAEIRSKIEELKTRIDKGDNFEVLARLYSEDPGSASKGGEIGLFSRNEMFPEFEAAAFALKKPGDISPIIETQAGFHIIQLIERKGEYINVRHILKMVKVSAADLYNAKLKLDTVYEKINSGKLSFAEASNLYSNDPDKNEDGLLVNTYSGNTKFKTEEVESSLFFIVDKLTPGSINKPVLYQTLTGKQGYRIIYLKSRTSPHKANLTDDYQQIQEITLAAKKKKSLDKWVETKKSSTYIKIMPEYKGCDFKYNWF